MWQSSEHSKIAESYELKNTLGRGHFAVVKLAEHVFSGEKVAVKVIDKTKMDKVSADHLYHEVTCMKLVQHPNVVRLYQVIETSSKLYLILELGDGGDMFDYIMRHDRGLHEDLAKEYFAQIVSAIAYCHKLHVVHRDLKPENVVFFESQGLVKLTDFGFSNQYRPGEKLSTSCGSLAYSAPEILLGEEYDAPAVDVWSLGVILYMLVSGVAPFNEANDSETLINIMDCRYTMMDHVSKDCQDLIQRMIIREPSERIALSDIVIHPWLNGAKSLRRARRNSTPILVRNSIPDDLHEEILSTMCKANLADREEILKALDEDRYDHITSTYFLLAERDLLQQEVNEKPSKAQNFSSDEELSDSAPASRRESFDRNLGKPIPHKLRPMHTGVQNVASCSTHLYSVSPPNKSFFPPSLASGDLGRKRTTSSSSEESNSSFIHAKTASFIREHLTITPRHGFSVAHGGIDTLIEEEERSRSQTTTDDEGDPGDDFGNILNADLLASHLTRASLQIKRIKKRKSAPVLNEICEENEPESDFSDMVKDDHHPYHQTNHVHQFGRHSISTSSPYSHRQHHTAFSGKDSLKEDSGSAKSATLYGVRTGRPLRRQRSQRSSSSETSDDDSESQRTSKTNLSTVASSLLRRRDSTSDDDDDKGFNGGGKEGTAGKNITDISSDAFTVSDCTATAQAVNDTTKDKETSRSDKNNNSLKEEASDKVLLNNANDLPIFNRKLLNLDGTDHKIKNVFGVRSRSAESHTSSHSYVTSSRSCSSARSSCSSLSTSHRYRPGVKRSGFWVLKNSSSTRSDTGLVLRCHINNAKLGKCTRNNNSTKFVKRSSSSSSFSSLGEDALRVCSSLGCVNPKHRNLDAACESDSVFCQMEHRRSCSLPHRHRKSRLVSNKKNMKNERTQTPVPYPVSELNIDGCNSRAMSQESVTIKRSNISLASSTCSGSKFVVDPLNEIPPSPCLTPLPESTMKEINLPTEKESELDQDIFMFPSLHNSIEEQSKSSVSGSQDSVNLKSRSPTNIHRASKRLSIITKLNNLKSAAQGSRNSLSTRLNKSESAIVHKVKVQDCCSVM
ncbi:uncharacterized protein LOC143445102 [Clavelina lepadiformis]|uniref:uncharacterized protein LOC143445102 n=1 Tax=Clavelina lepadiformis TaxID=159417 RepID=UPI0040435044